jgi:hypothetical protein
MTDPRFGPSQQIPGERWNVNMPAIIGVVFVAFIGVVIWVLANGSGDSGSASESSTTTSAPANTDASGATTPLPTTPQPMPSSTLPVTIDPNATTPTTTPPTTIAVASTTTPTTVPVTAAPSADPDAVPGDLGVAAHPMQQPSCDGGFITLLASAIGDQASAQSIAAVLRQYPGANYLRTDQSCPSLTQSVNGEPVYIIFFGPFVLDTDACTARAQGPNGAYARQLSNQLGPDHTVVCT